MKFLPTKVHGGLDYLVGLALIFAPTIFNFTSVGGPAVMIPRVLGIALLAYSIFTKYEWGVIKILPMPYHLAIDFVAALFLALSPFIFGFYTDSANVWVPHFAVGVVVILVVLISQTQPGDGTKAAVSQPS